MEACRQCEEVSRSYREKPFIAPNNADTYTCPVCGQRWWCYNTYYELWTKIDIEDDFTWENVKRGSPIVTAVRDPAVTLGFNSTSSVLPISKRYEHEKEVHSPRSHIKNINGEETLMVQWIGDYNGNILSFQFDFPLTFDLKRFPGIEEHISELYVVYIGKADSWPWEQNRENILKKFSRKTNIAYLLYAPNEIIPEGISVIVEVVSLGDPNVGIIAPRDHYDELNHIMYRDAAKKK